MEQTAAGVLQWFERAQRALEDLPSEPGPLEQRVSQLAEILRSLVPGVSLYGCALRCQGGTAGAALDSAGNPLRLAADRLAALLTDQDTLGKRAERLLEEMAAGQRQLIEEVHVANGCCGLLALAVPPKTSSETELLGRLLLRMMGSGLTLQLRVQMLQQEVQSQTGKADVGEVAAPLAHELNNWLNALLLHVAVLEQEVPESCRSELSHVRRQSKQLAALIKEWQQYRQAQHTALEPIDVNQIIRETANEPVKLALASQLPKPLGSPVDLKRLLRFLLNQTLPLVPAGKALTVRTDMAGSHVVLRFDWDGSAADTELLTSRLDLSAERESRECLEMAACDTLVRRMQGQLRIEKGAKNSSVIVVELPAAPQV
jgi:signal transduction histidine kinase